MTKWMNEWMNEVGKNSSPLVLYDQMKAVNDDDNNNSKT